MRWLQRFRHLWAVEEVIPPDFEAEEQRTKATLENQYSDVRRDELEASIDTLSEDVDEPPEQEESTPSPDYDVGEVAPTDLFDEEETKSHYSINVVDAEIEGADKHLLGAERVEPE